ncbi:hypothetical protein POVWA2_041610 [Plasmodium ovale wallikeri]|uniref:Uncharacterized protein n=2 Tax=Plasmodium ovale TaxID=36330 RepID=A0A1A8ZAK1_PLAOA|nr:hypothetical protein POVWA1_043140 [Plasmodium ovale wallikeri]SBT41286.1 hypothetical protein POVWA2_041610 [Plasmodium ovale wallikeri]SBT78118.1 conserved Plasmodium protein, unknown function [Plasmodium ovale]
MEKGEYSEMEPYDPNAKLSFFDDGLSAESKREKQDEVKGKKEEEIKSKNFQEIKNEVKICNININNEMETAMCINFKRRKTANEEEEHYSFRLPKCIDVSSEIIRNRTKGGMERKPDGGMNREKSEVEEARYHNGTAQPRKNRTSLISWVFNEDMYNKIKNKGGEITGRKGKDSAFTNACIGSDGANTDYVEKHTNEPMAQGVGEIEIEGSSEESSNLTEDDMLSEVSNFEEFFGKYDVQDSSDIMSISSDEPIENKKNLCNNLKCIETNSFIVEYEDGKNILFVNEKPYILEEDKEVNYLIECTEENMMPIHCKLEKKFFVKSVYKEEQIHPSDLNVTKTDVYYSLNDDNMANCEEK